MGRMLIVKLSTINDICSFGREIRMSEPNTPVQNANLISSFLHSSSSLSTE